MGAGGLAGLGWAGLRCAVLCCEKQEACWPLVLLMFNQGPNTLIASGEAAEQIGCCFV